MMLVSLYYVKTYRLSYPGPLKGFFIMAYFNAFLKVEIKSLLIPLDNWDVLIELDTMFLGGDPFTPINSTFQYSEVLHASVQKNVAHLVCNLANYCLLGFVVMFVWFFFLFSF